MKKKLEMCSNCNKETWHMVGKKQAHQADRHYNRRSTSECTKCGTKEIINRAKGRRTISRRNETATKQSTSEDKDGR